MDDHYLVRDNGVRVPTGELSTCEIYEILQNGFETNNISDMNNIRNRLELELFIRSLGLSTVRT